MKWICKQSRTGAVALWQLRLSFSVFLGILEKIVMKNDKMLKKLTKLLTKRAERFIL
ncbi:hypothetical protein FUSO4_07565 [Fusobacterium necrophorum DJ-1]|uniref:Uncharacterized protein n=2 Tax=Fusobacterium necrophorum TaxID=859 RepID=A0AB73BVF6_9FUSO|nr:hypothetical protein FUSO3_08315 [Fusobacterium necrophorum BL]KDE64761.1 hypothetical protein FUSO4_07565 [Fusobacterium necrophorum DJ-1]KDE66711.1 hypothetical protein FUSO5_02195 [Fusobacterium necrophorum BFTR-1]KDE69774.1 hypothetical protein FUSO6_05665 [Fusobacterium necrophorum DAB]KDE69861.1 hypothetical protein FUSO7_11155 [Fusobacterium necrophorum BFTR-2]KDE72655.1 hypothetical protein FUSO8_04450 [Fusobacterium necrophorum DJ-2]